MKWLVLIRHGESAWNAEQRVQGQAGTGLSETGREQAKHTAELVAEAYPDAALYVSDLQRCIETAEPIALQLRVEPVVERGLRERDFGRWTGNLVNEVAAADPGLWERWRQGEDVVGEVGGETTAVLVARVRRVFDDILAATKPGGVAVCVTHGGPIWHGTRELLDLSTGVLGGVANASVTEIVDDPTFGRRLASWNQVGHLPVELRTWRRAVDQARRQASPPAGT